VFADPAVDRSAGEFPALPEAASEGRRVARRFHVSLLATGAQATRDLFLRAAGSAEVLHFAGHGVNNGGFGGLVLAGSEGLITGPQLSTLDLSSLKLVVLSSCASGIGAETREIDSDLLVQGFLRAGAARVLAAGWDVNSLAASDIMNRFYEGLFGGMSAAMALRSAVLSARSTAAHPAVWSAFQLYGAP
jgi:CHAT domain-containing protein